MLGWRAKWEITTVPETGSTNADLVAAARAGAPAGTVLVADHQHAGRGRLDRSWEAAPGDALLVSLLLRPPGEAADLHRVTWAVAVAAARACGALSGVVPELKWPNDLVVGSRKLGGILAETVPDGGRVVAVVVGLGLNLRAVPAGPLAPTAVALRELAGAEVGREVLLGSLLAHLDELDRHPDELDGAYRSLLSTLGRPVAVELPSGRLEGVAHALTPQGHLVVETPDGRRHEVAAGDVIHLRPT